MIGHEQAVYDFALHNVTFHDLRHISLGSNPVPHTFRVDHDARAVFAMIQATRLVSPNRALEAQPVNFFFKERLKSFRPLIRTAATRVFLGSLIYTHKNMMLEGGHGSGFLAASLGT